jgi:hypothetical protein
LMPMLVGGGDPSLINGASSSSSRFMLSSEAVGVGALAFSFTLIFYALIRWILHLWLGVRPGGHQRGVGAVPGAVVLDAPLCPTPDKIGWSGLEVVTSWSWLLSWSLPLLLEPCSALLPPPLNPSLCKALLHHWPKIRSSALSSPNYP